MKMAFQVKPAFQSRAAKIFQKRTQLSLLTGTLRAEVFLVDDF